MNWASYCRVSSPLSQSRVFPVQQLRLWHTKRPKMTSVLRDQHKTFYHHRRGNRGVKHQWRGFGMQELRQRSRGPQRNCFAYRYEVADDQHIRDVLIAARITRSFTRADLERTAHRDEAIRAPQGSQRTNCFGLSFEKREQKIRVEQVTRHYFAFLGAWFRFSIFAITASVCASETSTTGKPFRYRFGACFLAAGLAAGFAAALKLGLAAGLDFEIAAAFMPRGYHT